MTKRFPAALAVVVVAVGLGACSSNPSAKAVARDVVESMDLADPVRECMLDQLDAKDEDQLEAIGNANPGFVDDLDNADAGLRAFIEDLQACTTAG